MRTLRRRNGPHLRPEGDDPVPLFTFARLPIWSARFLRGLGFLGSRALGLRLRRVGNVGFPSNRSVHFVSPRTAVVTIHHSGPFYVPNKKGEGLLLCGICRSG